MIRVREYNQAEVDKRVQALFVLMDRAENYTREGAEVIVPSEDRLGDRICNVFTGILTSDPRVRAFGVLPVDESVAETSNRACYTMARYLGFEDVQDWESFIRANPESWSVGSIAPNSTNILFNRACYFEDGVDVDSIDIRRVVADAIRRLFTFFDTHPTTGFRFSDYTPTESGSVSKGVGGGGESGIAKATPENTPAKVDPKGEVDVDAPAPRRRGGRPRGTTNRSK